MPRATTISRWPSATASRIAAAASAGGMPSSIARSEVPRRPPLAGQRVAADIGGDRAWRDHVDADAGLRQLGTQRVGIADQAVLGGAIGGPHRHADLARDRTDEDQPCPAHPLRRARSCRGAALGCARSARAGRSRRCRDRRASRSVAARLRCEMPALATNRSGAPTRSTAARIASSSRTSKGSTATCVSHCAATSARRASSRPDSTSDAPARRRLARQRRTDPARGRR